MKLLVLLGNTDRHGAYFIGQGRRTVWIGLSFSIFQHSQTQSTLTLFSGQKSALHEFKNHPKTMARRSSEIR
ncbi:hypothetical protein MSP8887_03691 [Marinomonas spartinae]|nr:hypothetical protein MSP8887_03691 [Marinomonas spartinae]